MDKLKMESLDITKCNIEKIGALFPNVLTETKDENGNLVKAINFDKLKQELTDDIVDGSDESYDFTWVGKTQAIIEANTPIRKTLRPVVEDETVPTGADSNGNPYISTGSKNFDTTENLYIEGDNFEVLKLLQESYLNSIKMIYIDPPYNTGSDNFVYPDNYAMNKDEYEEEIEYRDEDGNIQFKQNNKTNPKFHSDWCSMIYQRLKLAKNLLTDDGIIFISIDDNEVENLKKICSEIFGESNFIAQLVWEKKKKGSFLSNSITNIKEYALIYSKNKSRFNGLIGELNSNIETYPCINAPNKREIISIPAGIESRYKEANYFLAKGSEISDTTMSIVLHSDLIIENGILAHDLLIEGNWRYSQEAMRNYAINKEIYITRDLYLRRIVSDTRYKTLKDLLPRIGDDQSISYSDKVDLNNLFSSGWGSNEDADEELRLLLDTQKLLDYPKPTRLLLKLIASYRTSEKMIILDFFSGSATTAHAVMQLNAEDGGNRKFIMVQLPEVTDEKSEAKKANYHYITEIGKERIRRAGEKIKEQVEQDNSQLKLGEEPKKVPDIGFRVLKCDSTNMKDVYYSAGEYSQATLDDMISNIKEDRNALDLLYGVLLDWGIQLSSNCETLTIDGITVYNYDDGSLIACLDNKKVSETAIREIAKMQPLRVVFRDSSFANSPDKINVEEIFKLNAPNTSVRVI